MSPSGGRRNPPVTRFVQQSRVDAEKVGFVDQRDQKSEDHQSPGVRVKRRPWAPTDRPKVQHDDFVSGPDRHAGAKAADEVVNVLALEHEDVGFLVRREKPVELEPAALGTADVLPHFHQAIKHKDNRAVAQPKIDDPVPVEAGQSLP